MFRNCFFLLLVMFLLSCTSNLEERKSIEVTNVLDHYIKRSNSNTQHVIVHAEKYIELPYTKGYYNKPQEYEYDFEISIDDKDIDNGNITLQDLLRSGELQIDVVGTSTPEFLVVDYENKVYSKNVVRALASEIFVVNYNRQILRQNTIRLTINSNDLQGEHFFSIRVWYPKRYKQYAKKVRVKNKQENYPSYNKANPWGDIANIQILSGDLQTRIVKVSNDEVEAIFGKIFSRYLYAAKINIRNKNPQKKLFVNTNSLKILCLFQNKKIDPSDRRVGTTTKLLNNTWSGYYHPMTFQEALRHLMQKISVEDSKIYIKLMENMIMPPFIQLLPLKETEKYIFFPREAIADIFGDKKTKATTFITQIDRLGSFFEGEIIDCGIKINTEGSFEVRAKGKEYRDLKSDQQKLQDLSSKLRDYQLQVIPVQVRSKIEKNDFAGAKVIIEKFRLLFGKDTSGILDLLEKEIDMKETYSK